MAEPRSSRIRLQPAGVAQAPTLRAVTPAQNPNIGALVRSLGNLNKALQNYEQVDSAIKNDPKSIENQEYFARLQQMTPDQLRAEAASNSDMSERIRLDAVNSLLGERASADFRVQWASHYNTGFDRNAGDAGAEFDRMRAEFAEDLPTEISKGNFYRLTDQFRNSWMEKDAEVKTSYAKEQINTTLRDGIRNSIDDAIHAGEQPEKIAEMVFAKGASSRDFLGLSGQEQNDTLFAVAQEYAQRGEAGVARALLTMDRKGSDGSVVPSLSRIASYTSKVEQLLDQADNKWRENQKKSSFEMQRTVDDMVSAGEFTDREARNLRDSGVYSDTQLANMVAVSQNNRDRSAAAIAQQQQKTALRVHSEREEEAVYGQAAALMGRYGGVDSITDMEVSSPDGNGTRTLSRKQIIDTVVTRQEEVFQAQEEQLVASGRSPEEVEATMTAVRVAFYAGNKLDNPRWSRRMAGIPTRATVETLKDPEMRSAAVRDAEQYRTIAAQNPAYASTLVDGKAKEWMEAYTDNVEMFGSTPEQAVMETSAWFAKPERERVALRPNARIMDDTLSEVSSELGLENLPVNDAALRSRASALFERGLPPDAVAERLTAYVKERSFTVNGVVVFDHRGLPKNFPELAQRQLDKIYSDLGEARGIPSANDLYLAPVSGETRWAVYSKSMGIPLGAFIDPNSLREEQLAVNAERDERIRKEAEEAEAARRAPRARNPRGTRDRVQRPLNVQEDTQPRGPRRRVQRPLNVQEDTRD